MAKKILIAMDESKNALKAVEYVADTVGKTKGVKITLYSVIPELPPIFLETAPSLHPIFKGKVGDLTALTVQKKTAIEKTMKNAKKTLVDAGIAAKNIIIKVEEKRIGIARDILKEAKEGQYDTIAIGRRGISGTKAFLFGSISNKVVQFARNCTVWVID